MSRIRPPCLDSDCSDRSARSDVLLREEPDEEEDDEEDEGNVTDDGGDDDEEDEEDDGGYSVRALLIKHNVIRSCGEVEDGVTKFARLSYMNWGTILG